MDGWMDGWMDVRVDGWMDGWVDGWMDGWMGRLRSAAEWRTGSMPGMIWGSYFDIIGSSARENRHQLGTNNNDTTKKNTRSKDNGSVSYVNTS